MPRFLADKSALARRQTRAEVREALDPLLLEGEIATCGIVDLELLYSATSPTTYKALANALRGMPRVALDEATIERALQVQGKLAQRSQHRAVPLPDLLIAACAENAGLTVIHYDADFERISELTKQPVQWIVPRGSVA
ncbi:MAG TPA: PIN domain nuclease [Solirubrobacteraceae bacterium]